METGVLDTVNFCVRDVTHPSPVQLLSQLFGGEALRGEVIAETDDGLQPSRFLVVRVPGLSEPLIVPAQKVQPSLKHELAAERRYLVAAEKAVPELTTPTSELRLQ